MILSWKYEVLPERALDGRGGKNISLINQPTSVSFTSVYDDHASYNKRYQQER